MANKNILNKKHTHQFIIDQVKLLRKGWTCTRVSGEYITMLEYHLRNKIMGDIQRHPTKGRTFIG